jgi:hypothetical protein
MAPGIETIRPDERPVINRGDCAGSRKGENRRKAKKKSAKCQFHHGIPFASQQLWSTVSN